jgi:hypothetical protein
MPRAATCRHFSTRQDKNWRYLPRSFNQGDRAYLDPDHPSNDVPQLRWRQFRRRLQELPEPLGKLGRACRPTSGDAMALFGCAPKRPLDYLGSAGLVWAINGGRVRGHWATWPCRRVA